MKNEIISAKIMNEIAKESEFYSTEALEAELKTVQSNLLEDISKAANKGLFAKSILMKSSLLEPMTAFFIELKAQGYMVILNVKKKSLSDVLVSWEKSNV